MTLDSDAIKPQVHSQKKEKRIWRKEKIDNGEVWEQKIRTRSGFEKERKESKRAISGRRGKWKRKVHEKDIWEWEGGRREV